MVGEALFASGLDAARAAGPALATVANGVHGHWVVEPHDLEHLVGPPGGRGACAKDRNGDGDLLVERRAERAGLLDGCGIAGLANEDNGRVSRFCELERVTGTRWGVAGTGGPSDLGSRAGKACFVESRDVFAGGDVKNTAGAILLDAEER